MLSKKFRRAYKYYYIKLVNSKGTVHSVAMGIAIGFFMSVAIPIGQVIVVVPLAFIFKAHRGMAVFFTFFSNPYTTPILYPVACLIGAKILGIPITFIQIQSAIEKVIYSFDFSSLTGLGWNLFISFMLGGPILGLIMAIPAYFISAHLIRIYRKQRKIGRSKNTN